MLLRQSTNSQLENQSFIRSKAKSQVFKPIRHSYPGQQYVQQYVQQYGHQQKSDYSIHDHSYLLQSKECPTFKQEYKLLINDKPMGNTTMKKQKESAITKKLSLTLEPINIPNAFSPGPIKKAKKQIKKVLQPKPKPFKSEILRRRNMSSQHFYNGSLQTVIKTRSKYKQLSFPTALQHFSQFNKKFPKIKKSLIKNEKNMKIFLQTDLKLLLTDSQLTKGAYLLKLQNQEEYLKRIKIKQWITFPQQDYITNLNITN